MPKETIATEARNIGNDRLDFSCFREGGHIGVIDFNRRDKNGFLLYIDCTLSTHL